MKLPQQALDKMTEYGVPSHMHQALRLYFEERLSPGSFLTNILANDFLAAAGYADDINRDALFAYAMWLYNWAPRGAYGSHVAVRDWLMGED